MDLKKNLYDCPYCRATSWDAPEFCPVCGESMKIAVLVCSLPIGNIGIGTTWHLYPRNYSIGSGSHDDIKIFAPHVHDGDLKLIYVDGHFRAETSSKDKVRKKELSCSFRIGPGILTLHYVMENNLPEYRANVPPAFGIALSASYQILVMQSLPDAYDKTLETVLRITGLEKAYYFSADKNMEVHLESSKSLDNAKLDHRFCEFSESIIHRAVTEEDDIVCMDLHKSGSTSMSDSMANLNLKQILCFPIKDPGGDVLGIVYADTQRANLLSPKLGHYKPVLRLLGKMLAVRLGSSRPQK